MISYNWFYDLKSNVPFKVEWLRNVVYELLKDRKDREEKKAFLYTKL